MGGRAGGGGRTGGSGSGSSSPPRLTGLRSRAGGQLATGLTGLEANAAGGKRAASYGGPGFVRACVCAGHDPGKRVGHRIEERGQGSVGGGRGIG